MAPSSRGSIRYGTSGNESAFMRGQDPVLANSASACDAGLRLRAICHRQISMSRAELNVVAKPKNASDLAAPGHDRTSIPRFMPAEDPWNVRLIPQFRVQPKGDIAALHCD